YAVKMTWGHSDGDIQKHGLIVAQLGTQRLGVVSCSFDFYRRESRGGKYRDVSLPADAQKWEFDRNRLVWLDRREYPLDDPNCFVARVGHGGASSMVRAEHMVPTVLCADHPTKPRRLWCHTHLQCGQEGGQRSACSPLFSLLHA